MKNNEQGLIVYCSEFLEVLKVLVQLRCWSVGVSFLVYLEMP